MKKLIIIITLFLSYNTYAQYVPKAGNKLNTKPNGILVPTSTTDDTPIARLELFATGVSTITPSALPIATGSLLGAIKVGSGLAIDGAGVLSATGGGGTPDTTVYRTTANSLSLSQLQTKYGTGLFYPQPAVFNGGGTSTSDYFNIIGATGVSGTGAILMGTSPTMTTPTLGVATATSINKVTITAPTTNATLTLAQGNTLQTTGAFTLNLTATANSTPTFPTGTVTLYGTGSGTITSANLATSVSNETGTGALVFGTSPTIATPNLTYAISTKTANYTVVLTDYTVIANTTSTAITFTLPTASSASGKIFNFKRFDSGTTNALTIQANGAELVDGTNTKVTTSAYGGFTVQSDGTKWIVIL